MAKLNFIQCFATHTKERCIALKLRRMAKKLYKLHVKYGANYSDVSIVPSGVCLTFRVNDNYIVQDFAELKDSKPCTRKKN